MVTLKSEVVFKNLALCREVVRSPMVEAQCSVQLAFPVMLKNTSMVGN